MVLKKQMQEKEKETPEEPIDDDNQEQDQNTPPKEEKPEEEEVDVIITAKLQVTGLAKKTVDGNVNKLGFEFSTSDGRPHFCVHMCTQIYTH